MVVRVLVLTSVLLLYGEAGLAQALVPFKGEGEVLLSYHYFTGNDHLFSSDTIDGESTRGYVAEGNRWFLGDTYSHTVSAGLDYGLTHRLALRLRLAYVVASYEGRAPVAANDDGTYRGTFQDFTGTVRYQLLANHPKWWVTPYAGITIPTHSYEAAGHSAPGRQLWAISAGAFAAVTTRLFGVANLLEGFYGYAYSETVEDVRPSRSTAGLEWSFFAGNRFSVGPLALFSTTHGGVDWIQEDGTVHHQDGVAVFHNQVAAASAVRVGATAGYRIGDRLSFTASFISTVSGENLDDADMFRLQIARAFSLTSESLVR